MKKKIAIVIASVVITNILVCVLLCGFFLDYFAIISPQPYTIYVNGEKIEDVRAYWYQGNMYVPVLGLMKLCGYEVNCTSGQDPHFVIDDQVYQLNIDECIIINGSKEYLRDNIGVRWSITVDDNDAYVLFAEISSFFRRIGKEQVITADGRNYFNKCVSFEINDAPSN